MSVAIGRSTKVSILVEKQLSKAAPMLDTTCSQSAPPTCWIQRRRSACRLNPCGPKPCFSKGQHDLVLPSWRGSRLGLSLPRASMDDFDFSSGPIEETKPSFTREAYDIPPPDPPKIFDNPGRKRKGPPKVTPAQAIVGSLIAAGCSVALFNFVRDSYFALRMNPPVHNAPYNLSDDINGLLCTLVAGFGGFAVLIFAVNSVGLAMLAFKSLSSPTSDATKGK